MLEEHHDLVHELPEHKEAIHTLKTTDAHFKKLFDEYEDVTKEILRIEKEIEAASDERLENLKKTRLALKDEMLEIIVKTEAA
ncbi:MAG: DUF465 domain-containing protein [Alphaproteobacteria bacterium]|nr:MAG: DUF465 domain-containing protein [Alphaproteobacteria bacterium]